MNAWSRKRAQVILLAAISITSVLPLRLFVESRSWLVAEITSLLIAFSIAEMVRVCGNRVVRAKVTRLVALAVLLTLPTGFAIAARSHGSPIAFEVSALTTFGVLSLAIATVASTDRIRASSLVLSGFLVLFSASISDDRYAAAFPIAWMLGLVWHLIANQWERLELAMPESVQRSRTVRPGILILSLIVLAGTGYSASGRFREPNRLQFGFMPTSGGQRWSDRSARRGVGDGDAAIAAKDRAESFGAVDSDIFLESTESTLFDMVSDMIGDPKVKNKWERRQAVGNANVVSTHNRVAKSEKGGGTFTTERTPPKKHLHLDHAKENSVLQWDGPTGIRLGLHRYDTFDGTTWRQSECLHNDRLVQVEIDGATWFFNPRMRAHVTGNPKQILVGQVKVIRLASNQIPEPMMSAGIHIKDVDRRDFFGIAEDGGFFMPGRDKVPPLTVVHVAGTKITEDELQRLLITRHDASTAADPDGVLPDETARVLDSLTRSAIRDQSRPADQLTACVDTLRGEFIFDRSGPGSATSLREFLQSRRGGDHLFATTAALMARRIGLKSRLVTGFYVRPDALDLAAGHASVMPQDVHVWAEVRLDDGRWIEIEPTPGYRQPIYRRSTWMLAREAAAAAWPIAASLIATLAACYLTRRIWIDILLTVVWRLTAWLRPRQRVRLAIRIIEQRARLAGRPRPPGKTQRAWLEHLSRNDAALSERVIAFCNDADSVCFGDGNASVASIATAIVDVLSVRTILQISNEESL